VQRAGFSPRAEKWWGRRKDVLASHSIGVEEMKGAFPTTLQQRAKEVLRW